MFKIYMMQLIVFMLLQGRVLIFLDAHMECVKGWIEPLLSRIANDRSVIAVPLIDSISSDNLQYQANEETFINGFSWDLSFDWYGRFDIAIFPDMTSFGCFSLL